jgi:hypothetical protein
MGEVKRSANSFYTYMIILITVPRIGCETLVNKGETHFRPLVPVGLKSAIRGTVVIGCQ